MSTANTTHIEGTPLPNSRLRIGDVLRVGASGLRTRRLRTGLSTLGVAIGIAAMVGVLGLSASSREELQTKIRALGTNLLEVQASAGFGRGAGTLPDTAVAMVSHIGPVTSVSSIATVAGAVRRTDTISSGITSGISVFAADADLLDTLHATLHDGRWLDAATSTYPATVLGSIAAAKLGIVDVADELRVRINDEWFAVIGILDPVAAAPGLDRAAAVGIDAASTYLVAGAAVVPETIFVRTAEADVAAVRNVLSNTVNPATPEEVQVSRPSDALAAQDAASTAFTSLFLGLGAVALLVGGIGIANVMVIAVIERRSEIGLRRALGATKAHIRRQFLTEAVLLSGAGGVVGVGLGAGVTAIYASIKHWQIVIPPIAIIGGVIAAIVIGGVAGLYPASRAARLAPTEALRSN